MKKPDIIVVPGEIALEDVDVLRCNKDILIIEADTRSKYAGTWMIGGGLAEPPIRQVIHFSATPDVLRPDEEKLGQFTDIQLPPYMHDWIVLVDWRRYTIRIVAHRPDMHGTSIYKSR